MKNFVVLTEDVSTLVSEVNSYIATLDDDHKAHYLKLFHKLGSAEDFIEYIPSLSSVLADEGLTPNQIGHWCSDGIARAIPSKTNLLLVPLANVESCSFQTHILHPDALPYKDFITDHIYYDSLECDLVDIIEITNNPILVAKDTLYSVLNSGSSVAEFLLISFNEEPTDLLAE